MAKASSTLVAAIKAGNKNLCETFALGNMRKAAACYTKDAKLLPPNGAACNSHTAIERFWSGARELGVAGVTLRTVEVDAHGTTAIEYGAYTLKDARGKKLDNGKYVVVWKNQRGKWKLHWDIFNSNNAS